MRFSDDFLYTVKDRNPIEDVVSQHVALKRAGSNLVGLCPFHSERTPSFTVFPATNSFYCFGCGTGGDAITFVMQTENCSYAEAVESLARRAGIPLEETKEKQSADTVRRERVYEATKEAARFFHNCLMSEKGAAARKYLEGRKLTSATVKHFGIGYSPDGWDNLWNHLSSHGYTEKEAVAAFLVKRSDKGRIYDIFRNRIMFPLIDTSGNVVGFSARRLNEQDERKYVNTSDTPAFKKSKFVFALNFAKLNARSENRERTARKDLQRASKFILCEGCVDVISLHQAGFCSAIATLGTAITSEQARMISKYTDTVYLAYDIDKAGRNATLKGIELLSQVGVGTKIINLGDIKDPDEYIKRKGAEAFDRVLDSAGGEIDYKIFEIISKFDISVPEDKLRALAKVTDYIGSFNTLAMREVYSARAAELLSMTPQAVKEQTERKHKIIVSKLKKEFSAKEVNKTYGYGDSVNHDRIKFSASAMIEERIIGILFIHPEYFKKAGDELNEDLFCTDFIKKVFTLFLPDLKNGSEPVIGKDGALTAAETGKVSGMIAERLQSSDTGFETLKELIKKLKEQKTGQKFEKELDGLSDNSQRAAALEAYIKEKYKK